MKRLIAVLAVCAASLAVMASANAASGPACAPVAGLPYVGSVSVNSTDMAGASYALPAAGQYKIVACGVWNNLSHGFVDAAYNSGDNWNWNSAQQGWPGISPNWGELTVNGSAPTWGPYNSSHTYSASFSGSGTLSFLIWDGYPAAQGGLVPGWYGDNSGSLSVDIYKLLPSSADQCKKDGWQAYGIFKNQGDCVSYVATQGKNQPAGASS